MLCGVFLQGYPLGMNLVCRGLFETGGWGGKEGNILDAGRGGETFPPPPGAS